MGTRHIVEVIKDNKTVIRQYGQWDGYAETAAYELRNFIKKHGADKVRELITLTEIQDGNLDEFYGKESCMWLDEVSKYVNNLSMLGDFYSAYDYPDLAVIPAVAEKFGLEKTMQRYMMTRDTGYKILDVLHIFSCFKEVRDNGMKIPVFLVDESWDTGRKIIINLDDNTFTCAYFGKEQTWSFGKLPTLSELRQVDKW